MIVEHASSTHMQKLERTVEGEALEEVSCKEEN